MALKFYNTLSKNTEEFAPLSGNEVRMYSCGPTVYNYAHIGNMRAYVFADIIKRSLQYEGYTVKHVINVTDIGHLQGDADDTEDKMTGALKREGLELNLANMRTLANKYFEFFKEDIQSLNILMPDEFPFASDNIAPDIELIQTLIDKGYGYKTSDGIYFDTSKMDDYGKLAGLKMSDELQSRINGNSEKRNARDFALWKLDENIGYDAPFGKGFPGWHIECSAMSMKYLGETFDIHTGGIDHIPIHHTNEIAQSECATGQPLATFWMHNEFVNIEGEKISKSLGNTLYLRDLKGRGISPVAYRYWLLTGHYRTLVNLNWESLEGAETAYRRILDFYLTLDEGMGNVNEEYGNKFKSFIEDDLDTPRALALLWEIIKDANLSDQDKRATLLDFDRVLGLGFESFSVVIPDEVQMLVKERERARDEKDFARSDDLRGQIKQLGFEVKDTGSGQKVFPVYR